MSEVDAANQVDSSSKAAADDQDEKKESSSSAPKRVRVKKWNAVAFWAFDIENDVCAICHNQLMVPCITCEAEPHHAEECSVAWGQCSHSYHFHCITRWLKTRSTCPLDDEEWDFVKY